jgi:hypothetical protein
MKRADVFRDAAHFPRDRRLYTGTNDASLAMPADLVGAALVEWVATRDPSRPFFDGRIQNSHP